MFRLGFLLLGVCAAASALAEEGAAPPPPGVEPSVNERLSRLEAENVRLRKMLEEQAAKLDSLREDHEVTKSQVRRLLPLGNFLTGYVDMGFFYVQGDGTGIRPDTGHLVFPEYNGVVPDTWTFMGDPLSTAINSRGDPADTQGSRAVTFNPIASGGKATFLINNLNLAIFGALTDHLQFNGLIDFVPRGRNVSNSAGLFLGDYIDIKLAYFEYELPINRFHLSISAGKFDSVLGWEYRSQESPDRITITPSLICRYTCGRPIGIKSRWRFLDERLVFNFAVTNGSHFIEQFPLYNETDSNFFKTLAGRLSYKFPVGAGLEIGASGAFGAQDFQSDDAVYQWHYGFDVHLQWRGLEVAGEFVQGAAEGKTGAGSTTPCDVAACLHYMGAYGLVAYRILNWLMPYARVDWRDALHISGHDQFIYITDIVRLTAGLRVEVGTNVIIKAEYVYDRKLGRLPQFPDDIFTSSVVVKY